MKEMFIKIAVNLSALNAVPYTKHWGLAEEPQDPLIEY